MGPRAWLLRGIVTLKFSNTIIRTSSFRKCTERGGRGCAGSRGRKAQGGSGGAVNFSLGLGQGQLPACRWVGAQQEPNQRRQVPAGNGGGTGPGHNPPSPEVSGRVLEGLFFVCPACRSEEHTSELQSRPHLVCRLLLEKKK